MHYNIPAHRVETILQDDGKLTLEQLPFQAGQAVEVIILARPTTAPTPPSYSLRGKPLKYDRPFEPVADTDWETS